MEAPAAAAPPPAAAPAAPPAPAAAAPAPAAPAPHAPATVADVVAATQVGAKRRRAGLAPPSPAPAAAAPGPATVPPAPVKKSRPKVSSRGPRGASSKAAGASPKRKKVAARKKTAAPAAAIAEPPPTAHEVFEEMATPTSFMDLLQDAEVDLGAPPLEPFGEEVEEDEEDEGDDKEEVAEIGEEAFTAASRPHARSTNYTEAKDILLVCAWASVGMDAITGMRYKEMAASKGKPFPFKHAWAILQTFDKWKLRDQETAPKKSAMLRMDDSEDEEKERKLTSPREPRRASKG
ncbi:DNA mismatch repair protein Msh6-1 [Hordeum vulgare]|nr:DNA mismatch repair protein Msh6-1 [Hordeum vulgare]